MAQADIERLLAPASESPPCGLDPEDDALWFDLERLAEGREGSQWDEEGVPPDWPGVRDLASRILGEAKHLQAAYWLTNALLATEGLAGLKDGISLMFGLCRAYWQSLYPLLDEEDDDPAYGRMSVLADMWVPPGTYSMGDEGVIPGAFQDALLTTGLAESRALGTLRWRDVLVARRQVPARDADTPEIVDAFANLIASGDQGGEDAREGLETTRSVLIDAVRELREFDAFLTGELGSDGNVSGLGGFATCLDGMAKHVGGILAGESQGAPLGQEPNAAEQATAATSVPLAARPPGEIQSRDDVIQMLGRVTTWLERNEPSSPVPLMLKRAARLVGADFWAIVAEIADDAERQVEQVVGSRPRPDDDDDED